MWRNPTSSSKKTHLFLVEYFFRRGGDFDDSWQQIFFIRSYHSLIIISIKYLRVFRVNFCSLCYVKWDNVCVFFFLNVFLLFFLLLLESKTIGERKTLSSSVDGHAAEKGLKSHGTGWYYQPWAVKKCMGRKKSRGEQRNQSVFKEKSPWILKQCDSRHCVPHTPLQ